MLRFYQVIILFTYFLKSFLNCLLKGDGGQAFKSGIETQMIRAGPGNSLGVVSPTGRLNLNGPQKINLGSFAGPINVQALNHIHLRARRGNVSSILLYKSFYYDVLKKDKQFSS